MSDKPAIGVPPGGHHHPVYRAWTMVVDGLAALATAFIAVLMAVICADIVVRNGFGGSLPLVSELGAMMVVLIVALQLPSAIRAGRLAQVEMVIGALEISRPRLAGLLNALFCLAGSIILGIVAWASFGILGGDWASGDFIGIPGLGTLPTWPFRTLITLGMSVAAAEFLFKALRHLHASFFSGKGPS
ncbi:TRAP transporter small permease subunit [Devosia sp. XGJD_8]|jgi:TRAP-type C4-dicarboxylate transport system permease small subunit|uniref:TRAP transporter small permease subunit n=1 Tax=Devosia sp. XGJD_8 TaxID=3391187 RepID=UPI00398470C2